MDPLSMARANVTMLVEYLRTPPESRSASQGSDYAREALQIVKDSLQSFSGDEGVALMKDFEAQPDSFDEMLVKHLLRITRKDKAVAKQLNHLLTQFHRERALERKAGTMDISQSVTYDGFVMGGSSVAVGGDVKGGITIDGKYVEQESD
ncbi:MAG: hypothetical protein PVF45_06635 [Anaerolineae bacterium]|jgi:hypothetical protein